MVDTGIFCTTLEVQYKAGANASIVSNTEAYINSYVAQAESFINTACRYNFSDVYTNLNADVKGILKEIASCLAAMNVIQYDMSGFTSRTEAQTMLDVLRDRAVTCLEILKDRNKVDFVRSA
jgi:hypothetical protein